MKVFRSSIFVVGTLALNNVYAEEYFGSFQDRLEGSFINAKPWPVFTLSKKFGFEDPDGLIWSVPSGENVNGASIPPAFWSLIGGPFSGLYNKASVIHDYYCDTKTRTEHGTHRNFYYGMRANGVAPWKAKLMYWVVATFGPKWETKSRVVQTVSCSVDESGIESTCSTVGTIEEISVISEVVDLDDPQVLAVARSKVASVAKTLNTSKGKILDISSKGNVLSSISNIAQSAESYRSLFADRSYLKQPKELGVLAKWNANILDGAKIWKSNKLPKIQNTVLLKSDNLEHIFQGRAFRVDDQGVELLKTKLEYTRVNNKHIRNIGIGRDSHAAPNIVIEKVHPFP